MDAAENDALRRAEARRLRMYRLGFVLTAVGIAGVGGGFALGEEVKGGWASVVGVATGISFVLAIMGGWMGWRYRSGLDAERLKGGATTRRDRMQMARVRHLLALPAFTVLFLYQASGGTHAILTKQADFSDYIITALPVLYGWLFPAIVMGWDSHSRQNRKYLDDELTRAMRAKSVALGFVAAMAGLTLSFGLGLWRVQYGVMALPYVLAISGATVGLRFAWLDREAGRNG